MPNPKLTKTQIRKISQGIAQIIREHTGSRFEIDETTTLLAVYEESFSGCVDEICPLEVLDEICQFFDVSINENRWLIWLEAKQRDSSGDWQWADEANFRSSLASRTVDDLAHYIGKRMKVPSFEPVVILGNRCAPAGAFYGIRTLLGDRRIAPSTSIRRELSNSQIRKLWSQIDCWSEFSARPLVETRFWSLNSLANWIEALCLIATAASTVFLTIICILVTQKPTESMVLGSIVTLVSGGLGYAVSKMIADHFHNPLPADCVTFRDLAKSIAGTSSTVEVSKTGG